MSEAIRCPVCGKEKKPVSLSEYDCEYCGFQNAFIDFFAGEKSYRQWQKSVQVAIQNLSNYRRNTFSRTRCLRTGSRMIAFLDREKNQVCIAQSNGRVRTEKDTAEFDSSERNYAVVSRNGTVKVFGNDNEFGQMDTESWRDVRQVVLTPCCTYGLTAQGSVLYSGSPADSGITQWKNIRALRSWEDFLAGIRKDGILVFSGNMPADSAWRKAEKWSSIHDLVLFRDGAAGLKTDGTVVFAGREDDPRSGCRTWKNIIAIDADNAYVYGLSENGEVHAAGRCSKFLDRGRSGVSDWKNILVISCNQAGIGALDEQGNFHFAGTLAGDEEKITSACGQFMSEFL